MVIGREERKLSGDRKTVRWRQPEDWLEGARLIVQRMKVLLFSFLFAFDESFREKLLFLSVHPPLLLEQLRR